MQGDPLTPNNKIVLTNIPIGPPGTSRRDIYRTADLDPANPGTPTYHLVHSILNNTDVTWDGDTVNAIATPQREIAIPFPEWQPLTDAYPSLAVGALAFDPDNPDTFYLGTGSKSASNKGGPSVGLLKTTDGGKTFSLIGESEFYNLKIRDILVNNFEVEGGFAQYDAQHGRLTLFFEPDETTAEELVRQVNSLLNVPLVASLFQQTNDGSGSFSAGVYAGVTSGGDGGTRATGAIFPDGSNNAVSFTAENNGAQYNNLMVRFVGGGVKGQETAVLQNNILTVTLQTGENGSTANEVITAINQGQNDFRAARAENDGSGTLAAGLMKGALSGGKDAPGAKQASVLFNPSRVNTAIQFTAKQKGILSNDIEVVFRDTVNQVLVATEQQSSWGGLFVSLDGGALWRQESGTAEGSDITADKDHSTAVVLGDLNGDGLLDVVIGNTGTLTGAKNRLYLNNGTSLPFHGVEGLDITTDAHKTSSLALGDFNEDGHLDLVVGNTGTLSGTKNRLYLNNGTFYPFDGVAGIDISADAHYTSAIAVGDVNKDGHLDVIAGNYGERNRLYLGNGDGTFQQGVNIGTESNKTTSIVLGSFHGDEDLDLIVGNDGQVNQIYPGNGDGTFQNGQPIGAETDHTQAVAVGDINRDGRPDLVVGNKGEVNRVYLGAGGGGFSAATPIGVETDNTTSIALGDVDGDNNLDVVVGNSGGLNYFYVNNTTAGPFQGAAAKRITWDKHTTNGIALGDITGDNHNQLDLVAANTATFGRVNRLYTNFGNSFPSGTVTDLLCVPVPQAVAETETAYFAAVIGGAGGAYLDLNTVDESHQDRLAVEIASIQPQDWQQLEDTRSFMLTVGNNRQTVTPDFSSVTKMSHVQSAFQTAIDAAFGTKVLKVTLSDTVLTFEIPAGNSFQRVERLEDPQAGETLLGPLTPGIYRSYDYGATWDTVTGEARGANSYFRTAGRVELAAHIPQAGIPTLYAATLQGVRISGQENTGGQLQGIFRCDNLTDWRFIMDTPVARDLNSEQLNQAMATIKLGGTSATDPLYWRNTIANSKAFYLKIGSVGHRVTPDFRTVPNDGSQTMQHLAAAIENALNSNACFGPQAVKVSWDNVHNRFEIVSLTMVPITELSAADVIAADSLFNTTLEAHFTKAGDVNPFREYALTKVTVTGNNPTVAGSWTHMMGDYSFRIKVGGQTEFISPNFFNDIPVFATDMEEVAKVLQNAINSNANIRNQVGENAVTVVWDGAHDAFLFISNNHLTIQIEDAAPVGNTSIFDISLANARFDAIEDTFLTQVIKLDLAGTNRLDAAAWRVLGTGTEKGFELQFGRSDIYIRMDQRLGGIPDPVPANATGMRFVARAFDLAINEDAYGGFRIVTVSWNAQDNQLVIVNFDEEPLVSVRGFSSHGETTSLFDPTLAVRLAAPKDDIVRSSDYNLQLSAVLKLGAADQGAMILLQNWRNLGNTKRFRVTIGERSFFIQPDFTGVTAMGNVDNGVARRIEEALNRPSTGAAPRGFGANAVSVRWDEGERRFILISNTRQPFVEISDRGLTVAESLFNPALAVRMGSAEILSDFALLEKAFSSTAIRLSTDSLDAWHDLGNSRSFSITVDGVTKVITPNFTNVDAPGNTIQDLVAVFRNSINGQYAGGNAVTVVYQPTFKTLIITSTSNADTSGVADIRAPPAQQNNAVSLVEAGRPYFITGTITGLPGEEVTVAAGSSDYRAWKGLEDRYSFKISLRTTRGTIKKSKTLTVTPDFTNVKSMDDVAAAIAAAINGQASTWNRNAVGSFGVDFDESTLTFTITSSFERSPGDLVHITDLTSPASGKPSLIGPVLGAFLLESSLKQPEQYTTIHPGEQGGKHFSLAADPTDADFIYVGGDRQDRIYDSKGLVYNQSQVPDYAGILFRVDTAETAPQSLRTSPHAQDQIVGMGAAYPAGSSLLDNLRPVGTAPHADSRFITFAPDGSLIEADDGGIFTLLNPFCAGAGVSLAGNPNLTFTHNDDAADTITRAAGNWVTDGFGAGQVIAVSGSLHNNGFYGIQNVTNTILTLRQTINLASR
ncbi:MAG: VCBS repeat-containing protein [Desulfuromonadales bacterium]